MKQWALITGASQGIGYELGKLFAADGTDVVLVARDAQRLEEIGVELRSQHGVKVRVLAKDLREPTAAREIFDELQREGIEVSALVNNAGIGFYGRFMEVDLQRHLDLIQVNVTSLTQLTHLFAQPMLARREGRILNVASIASFMSGPFLSVYYASKAFVHSFSQALGKELEGSGVTVTALYPGLTRTKFQERAGLRQAKRWFIMEADAVARIGYRAMLAGKPRAVAGFANKIFVSLARVTPAWLLMWAVGRANRGRLAAK